MTRTNKNETDNKSRGAIAVEFALVAPLLLALITGVVEFANIFNSQISVTQAAREAARTMAVKNSQIDAKAAAVAGAPGINSSNFGYSFSAATCTPDATVKITITYPAPTLTGLFGSTFNVTGVGAMRCNG
ncbi:TadE/TadG family type IV pilus assembly protein [Arthrobacter sp. W4I7]|uniref:TadE/TadG family type IV pilus assembly protein n=1 Tax=Arthrobacter sp. W4I7 TaxID=3042296 RepID=UPI002785EB5D|nr:TadE/TadG family type IV pilus assembly protein [Arthrobacter sp. W4I7]MDQ0690157.1 Flp pilus assembly protein TadG [Arthrobacter sp. W4I7]